MAIFNAINLDLSFAGNEYIDNGEHAVSDEEEKTAGIVGNNKILNKRIFGGVDSQEIGFPWFDNIIVEPEEIDFDFIVDDVAREFKILSTYRRHEDTKTQSIFSEVNFDGLQSLGVTVPKEIAAQCDQLFTLIALRDGPATQASQVVTQIGGDTFTINISGLRVSLFPFLPNWANGYTIGLIFQTVIFKTSEFVEQRRAIHKEPRHRTVFEIALKSVSSRNLLRQLSKKIVGVPWHNDFVRVTNITGAIVDTSTNLDELSFLPVSRFLCFIDEKNPENNEVVEIDSFTTNQIICKKDISISANSICCYPLYLGTVRIQDENFPAPNFSTYTIVAEEI